MNTTQTAPSERVSIIGAGKIGQAIANGLILRGIFSPTQITLTRRNIKLLDTFKQDGYNIQEDNATAAANSEIVIVAVGPRELVDVLQEIKSVLKPDRHILVSPVTGIMIEQIKANIPENVPVVRIMPNTAITIGESMTCLACDPDDLVHLIKVQEIFDYVGRTAVVHEELMAPATALAASGLAFFLRSIRAASQGGTEIGFHAEESIMIAAQTAKGAASLLLSTKKHPESEIDNVTTPKGITIAGLNEMEHQGFSSAMIKAIVTSANKIATLLNNNNK